MDKRDVSITGRAAMFAAAGAANIVTTLVTLPFATSVLDPRDYGAFALVTGFVNVAAVVASAGHSLVVAAHLGTVDSRRRREMVSTIFALALAVSTIVGALTLAALELARTHSSTLAQAPGSGAALAVIAMILFAPWYMVGDVLSLDGRATAWAVIAIAQSVVNTGALLLSIFVFGIGARSLFIGLVAGNAAQLIGSTVAIRADLGFHLHASWVREVARTGPAVLFGSLAETGRTVVERAALGAHSGLARLGIYTHSQSYRAYMIQITNPLGRSLYPVSLQEARDPQGDFPITHRVWGFAQWLVIPAALILLFYGRTLIGLLTHGKFNDAAPLAVAWMMVLAVQMAGRPQNMTLLALNRGRTLATLQAITTIVGIGVLVAAVPFFGVAGAIAGQAAQQVTFRIGLSVFARRVRSQPFQDEWVVLGMAIVGAAVLTTAIFGPSGLPRAGIFIAFMTLWALLGRGHLLAAATVVKTRLASLRRSADLEHGPINA